MKYYVGDPRYVIKEWDEFCHCLFNNELGKFKYKGTDVEVHQTKDGDGVYKDNKSNSYFVDSGLIGIFPINILDKTPPKNKSHIHNFPKNHKFENVNGKLIVFNKEKILLEIQTDTNLICSFCNKIHTDEEDACYCCSEYTF